MIVKTLCLSTAHIAESTARHLDNGDLDIFLVGENEYSYTLYSEFDPEDDIPIDLRRVLEYAQSHDCRFVYLDCDEDITPDLPTYEWGN